MGLTNDSRSYEDEMTVRQVELTTDMDNISINLVKSKAKTKSQLRYSNNFSRV